MKKVLLLSCSTGNGHNASAKAIKEYFSLQGIDCEIRDALDFISERFAKFISWGHSFVYRYLPGLFRWGYQYSENHSSIFEDGSKVYKLIISGTEKLQHYILEKEYDTVICTHLLAAIMLTHIQENSPLPIQTAFVSTDYTCYPGMNACRLDKIFIANEEHIDSFCKWEIPQNQIVASGIPIRLSFFQRSEKNNAKRQLKINEENAHLLVMSGSMGCGPIKKIVRYVAKELPLQAEISVICGTNKRLYRSLNRRYRKNNKIHIVGYTDKISLYMDATDLYLTKPGGISVTEAAAKNLPMIFVNAVAGCEQYNMDFFLNMGTAVTADTPREIAAKSIRLLHFPLERERMKERLQEYDQPNGASSIYRELLKTDREPRDDVSSNNF